MRSNLTKIVLAAALVFAITLTLSCSSGGDDSGGGGNANGNGGSFNEDPQIYNEDGSLYRGNGIVVWDFHDDYNNDTTIQIISVTNGIVKLELPPFPEKYPYGEERIRSCEVSPKGTPLYYEEDFVFYAEEDSHYLKKGFLWLGYLDNGYMYYVSFIYSPTDAKITCNNQDNVNAKVGWNRIYVKIPFNPCDGPFASYEEEDECYANAQANAEKEIIFSTNNFFTKEAKWTLWTH